jgi:acyl dehydratase
VSASAGTDPWTLRVGDRAASLDVGPLTRTDFVRYQGASGDLNPIHHDDEFARAAGYPSVFGVGMLNAGLLATYVTDWLGVRSVRRFGVRFQEQVWPGDVLTCGAEVAGIEHDEGGRLVVEVTLTCRTQRGDLALVGSASFAFSS